MIEPFERSQEFTKHSQNFSEVKKGLTQIERVHKRSIRDGDEASLPMLRRLHKLTIGVYAEALLRKIVVDPNGFNDRERKLIWGAGSQTDRWLLAVELAFRRHYEVLMHQELSALTLDDGDFGHLIAINALLSDRLKPVIEDRNKTAHGQWRWHLGSRQENRFTAEVPSAPENYSSLSAQADSIRLIGQLVYTLVVSERTFQRDYSALLSDLDTARAKIAGNEYPELVALLRTRAANAAYRAAPDTLY